MKDIAQLISAQRDFFNGNQTKSVDFRIAQLKKLKKLLKENEQKLYSAIDQDFAKSEFETYVTELSLIYYELNEAIRNLRQWSARKAVETNLANLPGSSFIIPEPLGVTLVIGAWNYPYQLSIAPAIAALAAGNTVILKPSELPANTSNVMAELINAHFPREYFHVLEGGVEETTELLNQRFDKIFFTGSTRVGQIVYEAAAKHLTPVTLELGGKSPTFVLDDANINITAKRIVWSKFLNAGQTCIAPDYILVDQKIESKFLEAVKAEIEQFHSKHNPKRENYLQIINDRNFERLSKLIDHDKVYCGGEFDQESRYISPTVMRNVNFDDALMKDEIFGPILPVIAFDNLDEAIRQVKQRPKPLSCYIYSKSKKNQNRILHEISFGGGAINESVMHIANPHLPFGGVGFSGFGSYHGKAGFDAFTHYKSILRKPFLFEPPLKYPPYTKWKKKVIQWLME